MGFFPLGLAIAVLSFVGSILFLGQSFQSFFDPVALIMVIGGTIAAGVMVIPWELKTEIKWAFSKMFVRSGFPLTEVIADCEAATRSKDCPDSVAKRIYGSLLREGFELHQIGISHEKVEVILRERLDARIRRLRRVVNVIRGIAKFPPAFGLMGTVIGLVNVMRGVSRGMAASETALEMALALVATMYGLVLANYLIAPLGEILSQGLQGEEYAGEIAIAAVILSLTEDSQIVTSEFLQSYISAEKRKSAISEADAA
jgi:chemotaxis protein MotA